MYCHTLVELLLQGMKCGSLLMWLHCGKLRCILCYVICPWQAICLLYMPVAQSHTCRQTYEVYNNLTTYDVRSLICTAKSGLGAMSADTCY